MLTDVWGMYWPKLPVLTNELFNPIIDAAKILAIKLKNFKFIIIDEIIYYKYYYYKKIIALALLATYLI